MTVTTETLIEEEAPALEPVLSPQQLKALLRVPRGRGRLAYRDRALLALLAGAGGRVSEVVRLRRADLRIGPENTIVVRIATLKRQGHPVRSLVLDKPFAGHVLRYLEREEGRLRWWLFSGRWGEHLSTKQARKVVKAALGAIGRGDLRTHDLRHTWITQVLQARNGNIFVASKLAGHVDQRQVMRRYGHLLIGDALETARALRDHLARSGRPAGR